MLALVNNEAHPFILGLRAFARVESEPMPCGSPQCRDFKPTPSRMCRNFSFAGYAFHTPAKLYYVLNFCNGGDLYYLCATPVEMRFRVTRARKTSAAPQTPLHAHALTLSVSPAFCLRSLSRCKKFKEQQVRLRASRRRQRRVSRVRLQRSSVARGTHTRARRSFSCCHQVFQARFYASEVFLALQHLHKLGVIYRALPPVGQCLILGHKMGVISPIFLRQVI